MTDFIRELYYGNLKPQSEGEISDALAELVTHAGDLEEHLTDALEGELLIREPMERVVESYAKNAPT